MGIKVNGVGSGGVGVGSVENEKLHPVKRKHPINKIDMSLLFMAVPLHTIDNCIRCLIINQNYKGDNKDKYVLNVGTENRHPQ